MPFRDFPLHKPWSNVWEDTEDGHYVEVDINISDPIKLLRIAICALLCKNKKGVMVIITSTTGFSGYLIIPLYCVMKHAMIGFLRFTVEGLDGSLLILSDFIYHLLYLPLVLLQTLNTHPSLSSTQPYINTYSQASSNQSRPSSQPQSQNPPQEISRKPSTLCYEAQTTAPVYNANPSHHTPVPAPPTLPPPSPTTTLAPTTPKTAAPVTPFNIPTIPVAPAILITKPIIPAIGIAYTTRVQVGANTCTSTTTSTQSWTKTRTTGAALTTININTSINTLARHTAIPRPFRGTKQDWGFLCLRGRGRGAGNARGRYQGLDILVLILDLEIDLDLEGGKHLGLEVQIRLGIEIEI
ncbi:hypothetical protein IFR05_004686 [Cadophora sp. M221]|nr:hypothetical protein IFR05_004686 [Cadophora sp. M221]